MNRYMLDTNMVSHLIKGHPVVTRRIKAVPMASLCISSITEGELMFGLGKRPEAVRLHRLVGEFLLRVDVLSWDSPTARHYGKMRANMECHGKVLAPLDMLIAAHALALKMVLVTNDQAFHQVAELDIEDWTV